MKIYKYNIPVTDESAVSLPAGARILQVGLDPHDDLCFWAEVDPAKHAMLKHSIYVIGTGNELPVEVTTYPPSVADYYRGSVVMGPFVWHVYIRPHTV